MPLVTIRDDSLLEALKWLTCAELAHCQLVCRRFNRLFLDNAGHLARRVPYELRTVCSVFNLLALPYYSSLSDTSDGLGKRFVMKILQFSIASSKEGAPYPMLWQPHPNEYTELWYHYPKSYGVLKGLAFELYVDQRLINAAKRARITRSPGIGQRQTKTRIPNLYGNTLLCCALLRPLFESVANHQVPFVHPVTGERRLTRIFHDIQVLDYYRSAGGADRPHTAATAHRGIDDSGVEAIVRFPFNHRAILSLIEHGYIRHLNSVYDGEPYRQMLDICTICGLAPKCATGKHLPKRRKRPLPMTDDPIEVVENANSLSP